MAPKEKRRAASFPHHTPSEGALGGPQGEGVTARHSRPRDPERKGLRGPHAGHGGESRPGDPEWRQLRGPHAGHCRETNSFSPKGLTPDRRVGFLKTILKQGSQET